MLTFVVDVSGWFYAILLLHVLVLSSLAKGHQYSAAALPLLSQNAAWLLSAIVLSVVLILGAALCPLVYTLHSPGHRT